jgi:hypothetical protein
MKIAKSLLSVLAVSLWLAFATETCAADLMLGTWKLDVAKSKYSPGPAPKSATVTYEAAGDGYKRTGESIAADGKKTSFEYTAKYDGKDYPIKGSENFDAIAVKRIDDHNAEATLKKAGKVVANTKRNISKDGKVLTLTTAGTNAKGEKINNVVVYDRQ